eukprot:2184312-Rhodomonas_salina.1
MSLPKTCSCTVGNTTNRAVPNLAEINLKLSWPKICSCTVGNRAVPNLASINLKLPWQKMYSCTMGTIISIYPWAPPRSGCEPSTRVPIFRLCDPRIDIFIGYL